MKTAILVDGGFFLKRFKRLYGPDVSSKETVEIMYKSLLKHLVQGQRDGHKLRSQLYRMFFYDCPPISKKLHHPLTDEAIDLSKSKEADYRITLHEELKKRRKVALRLGRLADNHRWLFSDQKRFRKTLRGELSVSELREVDFHYDIRQKGVDMRIGLDIASIAFKKQVDQIVLVAGDADFVPAAKLARREGIDFVLDPMWHGISSDLHEHIDGLKTYFQKREAIKNPPP